VSGELGQRGERVRRARPSAAARLGLWTLAATSAAAGVVVLVRSAGAAAPPRWRVVAVEGAGEVSVGGRVLGGPARGEAAGGLDAGAVEVATEDAALELAFGDELVLRLAPRTRWRSFDPAAAGARRAELRAGEVYVHRCGDVPGPELVVATPTREVRITGTVLGVLVADEVTCVCVVEGRVAVRDRRTGAGTGSEGEAEPVGAGRFLRFVREAAGGPEPRREAGELPPYAAPGRSGRDPHVHTLVDFARSEGVR